MKSTPETWKTIEALVETARIKNTGYEVIAHDYEGHIYLNVRQPRNTDRVAYPEIFCKDDWYGEKAIGFEIATTGYGDHSIAQAQRAVNGLQIAIDLVEALLTTAELYGLKIHR